MKRSGARGLSVSRTSGSPSQFRQSNCPIQLGIVLLLLAVVGMGCDGDRDGRPNEELGTLVISPVTAPPNVDVDKASHDVDALMSLVRLPHTWTTDVLGAHLVTGQSSVSVTEAGQILEELDVTTHLRIDGEERFSATQDNSKEYGRHAHFDGKELYLRPRFGPYHARGQQHEEEANDIRNEIFAEAVDYLALVESQMELSDGGSKTHKGRAVREIRFKLAPKRRDMKPETLSQRKWRDSIHVTALQGQVSLDVKTGAVLSLQFEGSITYDRDGKNFTMSLKADRSIGEIDHTQVVSAPIDAEILRIPARRRALDERERLLKSIAPPAQKAPTPKPTSKSAGEDE